MCMCMQELLARCARLSLTSSDRFVVCSPHGYPVRRCGRLSDWPLRAFQPDRHVHTKVVSHMRTLMHVLRITLAKVSTIDTASGRKH